MKFSVMITAFAMLASTSPLTAGQTPTDQTREQQKRDQLRAAVQDVCPVSGEKLGSMGDPIKVQVGPETIFLCCKGCLKQKINPAHWATIHTNFAKAQRICPVMKKDLPKSPKWTVVEGQIIYVCCPPCKKKIAADPQKYLRAINALYAASLDARKLRPSAKVSPEMPKALLGRP
jgi:YHS domain-containing protein